MAKTTEKTTEKTTNAVLDYGRIEQIAGWVSSHYPRQDRGDVEQECIATGLQLLRDRPGVSAKLATTILYRAGLRHYRYVKFGTRGSRPAVSLDTVIATSEGEDIALSDTVADPTMDVESEAIVALAVASLSSEERHVLRARLGESDGVCRLTPRQTKSALEIGRRLATELDALAGRCRECAARHGAAHKAYCSEYVRPDARRRARGASGLFAIPANPATTRAGEAAIAEATVAVFAPTGTASPRPVPSIVNYHPLARVAIAR